MVANVEQVDSSKLGRLHQKAKNLQMLEITKVGGGDVFWNATSTSTAEDGTGGLYNIGLGGRFQN